MKNVIPFPIQPRSEFDAIDEARMDEAQRDAIRAALMDKYAAQKAREDAHRANGRTLTLDQLAARLEYEAHKDDPTPNVDGVRVGELFYASWGYDQTNIDFWQVVALKGKHTAVIREIACEYIGGFGMQGKKRPCRNAFANDIEYTVRTSSVEYNGQREKRISNPELKGRKIYPTTDDAEHDYSSYA